MLLGELQLPSSFEDALGAFPLPKAISPDAPASGVKKWVELESAKDTMVIGSDDDTRDDGSEAETSVIDDLPPLVPDNSPTSHDLSATLATLWTDSENIDNLPLAENFVSHEPLKPPKAATKMPWTRIEDTLIIEGVGLYGNKWSKIAGTLPEPRTDDAVRNRWHRLMDKQRRRSPPASDAGDATPPASKRQCSPALPRPPLADCDAPAASSASVAYAPKDEAGKHGDMWTADEDMIIDHAVRVRGLRWKAIAALLPGRTESGCRNRWVRNQERVFAAAGIKIVGAKAVFDALESARQGNAAVL